MRTSFGRFGALLVIVLLVGLLSPAPAHANEAEIKKARERADAVAQELSNAETKLGELESEINDLQGRADVARRHLGTLQKTVDDLVIEQFMGAGQSSLFSDGDINRQVKADALAEEVQQGNTDTIDDFLAVQADLAQTETLLEAKKAESAGAVENLKATRSKLANELAKLEEAERKRKAAEAAAKAEAERKKAAAAAAAGRPAPVSSGGGSAPAPSASAPVGGMVCPVQGAVSFIDSWGFPRSGGRRHKGVDMFAGRGTPVVAPKTGRLTHRGNSVGGLSFHLYADDGTYYYGTHLNGYANQGAGHVSAGTVVGYVGDSGNARGSGTHLHFEIHPNGGAAVNPYSAVRAAC